MTLERLDLSGNNITNLGPLASLRHLTSLNLSSNRISNIGETSRAIYSLFSVPVMDRITYFNVLFFAFVISEPLRSCESLQNLNVAGNIISRYRYITLDQMLSLDE